MVRQGSQAGGLFDLFCTFNAISLQTGTVTQSLSRVLLWEHFSQGNRSFPQASNFAAVTRLLTLLPPSCSLAEGEKVWWEGRGQGLCDLTEGLVDRACPLREKLSPQWA